MWVLGGSPDLSKATGGTYRLGKPQCRTSRSGLLLGRLGGVFGALCSPFSPADSALGNSGEESRCDPRRDRRTPDEQRGHAGPVPADPVT